MEKKIKVGLEIRESFHAAMKLMALERNLKLYQITDELLERALGESPRFERNSEWHRKLDLVLDYGSERDKIGIQQNLEWAAEHVSATPQRKPRTGS